MRRIQSFFLGTTFIPLFCLILLVNIFGLVNTTRAVDVVADGKKGKEELNKSVNSKPLLEDDAIIVEAQMQADFGRGAKERESRRSGRQFGGVKVELNHYQQFLGFPTPNFSPIHQPYAHQSEVYPQSLEFSTGQDVVDYEAGEPFPVNRFPGQGPSPVDEEHGGLVGAKCTTRNGKGGEGTCTPLKQCYTFMIGNDLDNDGVYEGNPELANMLKRSSGACTRASVSITGQRLSSRPHFFNKDTVGIEIIQSDLVCCAGNVTMDPSLFSVDLKTVGGFQARRNEFPYMAALMNNGRQFCGGTLITPNHVLTAAHCISHMNGNDIARMYVNLGDYDIYSNGDGYHEWRRISRVIKHAGFNSRTLHNDIAILRLSYAVPYNSHIKPVSLSAQVSSGLATVVGWGKLSEFGGFPTQLNKANVAPISNNRCAQLYGSLASGGILSSMICTDGTRTDACSGDSGGPLLQNGRQIGIVSWGIGCARYPGVYTRVGSFLSWISKNQIR